MTVLVEPLSATSVTVSWKSVTAPEIVSYTVYYRPTVAMGGENEQSVTVPSSENSVVIEGLMTGVQYQFQVAAVAELGGLECPGQRPLPTTTIVVALPTAAVGMVASKLSLKYNICMMCPIASHRLNSPIILVAASILFFNGTKKYMKPVYASHSKFWFLVPFLTPHSYIWVREEAFLIMSLVVNCMLPVYTPYEHHDKGVGNHLIGSFVPKY